ncbi:MAG: ImmA/IrrE family metallo-endopeptidase [Candidatus Thiodiazotropha sp. 6PLUC9]
MKIPSKSKISENRRLLQNPYAYLDDAGGYDAEPKIVEATAEQIESSRRSLENQYAFLDDVGELSGQLSAESSKPEKVQEQILLPKRSGQGYQWIGQAVKNIQKAIWKRRYELWPDGVPDDPVKLLDPAIALDLIGFEYEMAETLGQFTSNGSTFEVAGVIDRTAERVQVSRQMPFNTIRFTAAHELAHAVLHEGVHMHRDRALDGSGQVRGTRDKIEIEADKFASFFLMPENLVRKRFQQIFLCEKFLLNEATSFALDPSGSQSLLQGRKSIRELARILAKTESFNGENYRSLAGQFFVSIEAMAIRLEELDLLEI